MSWSEEVCGEKTANNNPEVSSYNEEKLREDPSSAKELSRDQSDYNPTSNGSDQDLLGEEALVNRMHVETPSGLIPRLQALFSILTVKLCLIGNNGTKMFVGSGSMLNPHTWANFSKLLGLYQLQGPNLSFTTELLIKVNPNFLARGQNRQTALYEISFENFNGLEDYKLRCFSQGFYQFDECTFLEFKVHISLCKHHYSKYQEFCDLIQKIPENYMEKNGFFLVGHENGIEKKIFPGRLRNVIMPADLQCLSIEEDASSFLMRTMANPEQDCLALLNTLFPGDINVFAVWLGVGRYFQDLKRIYKLDHHGHQYT